MLCSQTLRGFIGAIIQRFNGLLDTDARFFSNIGMIVDDAGNSLVGHPSAFSNIAQGVTMKRGHDFLPNF